MTTRFAGYAGQLLDVDLTAGTWRPYPLGDDLLERYVGGKTLAARVLWDECQPGTDPLSPDNVLVFTTGPFTGSGAPAGSRFNCSTRNVLTGGIASSNCGGDFGLHLKRAGYDGLIVRGRAARPTWIRLDEAGVELVDARHLWGLEVEAVQEGLPDKAGHVVIGPAGELMVRFACIMSGERALGRGGVGAVMGSKHLKLITASGAKRPMPHDPVGFRRSVKSWVRMLQRHSTTGKQLPEYGTVGMLSAVDATCTLPTHNFSRGRYEHADEVSGETLAERYLVGTDGCSSCPIRCGRVVKRDEREIKGPEFETVGMFGPNIENPDLPLIFEWNYLADQLGMDTISLGSTLATAMELKERGLFPELPVSFGDFEAMEGLLYDTAYRRGVGAEIAEGARALAEARGAPELAMHAKGMEFAAYEPRGAVGHGLGYATSNRGGCHLNGGYLIFFEALGPLNIDPLTPHAKPELTVFQQNTLEALSACGSCIFTSYAVIPDLPGWATSAHGHGARLVGKVLEQLRFALVGQGKMSEGMLPFHLPLIPHSRTLEELTGIPMSLGRFSALGERGFTLERLFNLREGLSADDDALPPRLTDELQRPDEPRSRVPLAEMMPRYYQVRDWDARGVPSPQLLSKLDLDFAAPLLDQLDDEHVRARRHDFLALDPSRLDDALARARGWQGLDDDERARLAAEQRRARQVAWAARVRGATFAIDPVLCRACGLCAEACPVEAIRWERGSRAWIDEEICIRCGTCHQACPPHFTAVRTPAPPPTESRVALAYRVLPDKCKKCGICFKHCPADAITWEKKALAEIDEALCVACGRCEQVCPPKFDAIERVTRAPRG